MHAQRRQLGDAAAGEHVARVLVEGVGDQDAEAGDVLAEDLEHAVADPSVAEVHAGPGAALATTGRAGVDRALEQGDAGLVPQAVLEQHRRVDGRRQQRSGDRLGQVVELGELLRADLEVDLEAGVAGLEHHVVVRGLEVLDAADQHVEVAASQAPQGAVQLEVTRLRRHVVEAEVAAAQGRQDAGQQHVRAATPGRVAGHADQLVELVLDAPQARAVEHLRGQVGLEVEARQLGGEARVGEALEHIGDHRGRSQAAVDQEHLLLGADPAHAGLEAVRLEHGLQRDHIVEQGLHEIAQLFLVDHRGDVLFAHVRARGACWPRSAHTLTRALRATKRLAQTRGRRVSRGVRSATGHPVIRSGPEQERADDRGDRLRVVQMHVVATRALDPGRVGDPGQAPGEVGGVDRHSRVGP